MKNPEQYNETFRVPKIAQFTYKGMPYQVMTRVGVSTLLARKVRTGISSPWVDLNTFSKTGQLKAKIALKLMGKNYDFCKNNHSDHHRIESEKNGKPVVRCGLCGHRYKL